MWQCVRGPPEVAGPVVAVSEGVVLQAEQAHIVGEVQLHPGGWMRTLIGGEPVIRCLLPNHPLYHVPGPPL